MVVGPAGSAEPDWEVGTLARLMLPRPEKGTWLVFYNQTPRKAGYKRSQLDDLRQYAPGFAIARLDRTVGRG